MYNNNCIKLYSNILFHPVIRTAILHIIYSNICKLSSSSLACIIIIWPNVVSDSKDLITYCILVTAFAIYIVTCTIWWTGEIFSNWLRLSYG